MTITRAGLAVCATITAVSGLCATPAFAQHEGHDTRGRTLDAGAHAPKIGSVSFANSGNAAAQMPFQRGVALMHNFEYDGAAEAFRVAQQRDPSLAIAYWLEAATYIQTSWQVEDVAAARTALARLGPTPAARLARARTARERAYGAAVEALVADTTEQVRARAFADSLAGIEKRYPTDVEAKAFAAIARIAVNYRWPNPDRAAQHQAELAAGALADTVFRTHPMHPGGAHYSIHAYDHPELATLGVDAARAYARIAPDMSHAQHMPSHIFVQLGLWKETAKSNERSYAAARRDNESDMHSLTWLQYGYTQLGRFRDARALLDSAHVALPGPFKPTDGPDERFAESELAFCYAAESGDWASMAAHLPVDTTEARPTSVRDASMSAMNRYHTALGALMIRQDTVPARVFADRSRRLAAGPQAAPGRRIPKMIALQLDGLIAQVRGDSAGAIELLQASMAVSDSVSPVGPPEYLVPGELLGNALLRANRPSDAAASFRHALVAMPNRTASLLGLARAQRRMGDEAGARKTYQQLAAIWVNADPNVPGLAEARTGARGTR